MNSKLNGLNMIGISSKNIHSQVPIGTHQMYQYIFVFSTATMLAQASNIPVDISSGMVFARVCASV